MDIRRFSLILIGVVLIAFGTGIYSLRYNDNIDPFSFDGGKSLNIQSDNSKVRIGLGGINVKDGNDHVQIGWDGINVVSGDDEVSIGWDGIKVDDGEGIVISLFDLNSWFSFVNKNLKTVNIDEQKKVELNNINNIQVQSSFIDVRIISENRDDIYINYHGKLRANVVPTLEVKENGNTLNIELNHPGNGYSVTKSNVILEIYLPSIFNCSIDAVNSSGDIEIYDIIGDRLNMATSSGEVIIENLEFDTINLVTSSGNIYSKNLTGNNISLVASSGDMKLNNLIASMIDVETSSGDVEFNLPNNSNYTIKGSSSSGRYTSSNNMDVRINNRGNFEASTGTGKNVIIITTSSGDVRFR